MKKVEYLCWALAFVATVLFGWKHWFSAPGPLRAPQSLETSDPATGKKTSGIKSEGAEVAPGQLEGQVGQPKTQPNPELNAAHNRGEGGLLTPPSIQQAMGCLRSQDCELYDHKYYRPGFSDPQRTPVHMAIESALEEAANDPANSPFSTEDLMLLAKQVNRQISTRSLQLLVADESVQTERLLELSDELKGLNQTELYVQVYQQRDDGEKVIDQVIDGAGQVMNPVSAIHLVRQMVPLLMKRSQADWGRLKKHLCAQPQQTRAQVDFYLSQINPGQMCGS